MKTRHAGSALYSSLALFPFLAGYLPAWAQEVPTWNGGGTTQNWSEGANWSTGKPPVNGQTAIFDATSSKDCTINDAADGVNIYIGPGYTGTLTQAAAMTPASWSQGGGVFVGGTQPIAVSGGFTLSGGTFNNTTGGLSAGGMTISGGVFNGSSGAISTTGGFSMSGGSFSGQSGDMSVGTWSLSGTGSFTSTSGNLRISGSWTEVFQKTGGTFNHGGGTVTLTGSGMVWLRSGGAVFNHLVISCGEGVEFMDPVDVDGDFSFQGRELYQHYKSMSVGGNFTIVGSSRFRGSGSVTFDGGGDQGLDFGTNVDSVFGDLVVNKPGGTLRVTNNANDLMVCGYFTLAAGTFDLGGETLRVYGDFTNTGTASLGTGTVILIGVNQTISGTSVFPNLTKTVTSPATLTFPAGLTQTITGTLNLQGTMGNLLSLRSSIPGTQWRIDPQGMRTIQFLDVRDSRNINAVVIDARSSGSNDSGNNARWSFSDVATWNGGGGDNNWSTAANWINEVLPTKIAVFDATSAKDCTIDVDPSGIDLRIGSNYAGTVTAAAPVTLSAFAMGGGTFAQGTQNISVSGNFLLTGGAYSKTSGTLSVSESMTITNGSLALGVAGPLDVNGTITLGDGAGGAGTALLRNGAGGIRAGAGFTVVSPDGSYDPNGGLLTFDGTGSWSGAHVNFGNVVVTGSTTTVTLGSNVAVHDLVLAAGATLDAGVNDCHVTASGNVNFSGGTFVAGTGAGTLTFNGGVAQSFQPGANPLRNLVVAGAGTAVSVQGSPLLVNGTTTVGDGSALLLTSTIGSAVFNGSVLVSGPSGLLDLNEDTIFNGALTVDGILRSVGDSITIRFSATALTDINGTIIIDGAGSNRITLVSTVTGDPWDIDLTGATQTFVDVNVRDSNAVGAAANATGVSLNLGNNTNWGGLTSDIRWIGAAVPGDWSAGANWDAGVAPTPATRAVFDAAGSANPPPTQNSPSSLGGLAVLATYSRAGSIALTQDLTLAGDLELDPASAATLQLNSNVLTVLNDGRIGRDVDGEAGSALRFRKAGPAALTMSGGVVHTRLEVGFGGSNTTVALQNANPLDVDSLTVDAGSTFSAVSGAVVRIRGDLTLNGSYAEGAGETRISGNLAVAPTATWINDPIGTLVFDGVALQTWDGGGQDLGGVRIGNAATVRLLDTDVQVASLDITAGATLDLNGRNLTVTGPLTVGGTLQAGNSTLTLSGDLDGTGGTIAWGGTGALILAGSGQTITIDTHSSVFNALTVSQATSTDVVTVNAVGAQTLTATTVAVNTGILDLNTSSTFVGGAPTTVGAGGTLRNDGAGGMTHRFLSNDGTFSLVVTGGAVAFTAGGLDLVFKEACTVAVNEGGSFGVTGASGGRTWMRDEADNAIPWTLEVDSTAAWSFSWAILQDSVAAGPAAPLTATDSVDAGDNTNWIITAALTATDVQPASLVAAAPGPVTITFTTANIIPVDGKIQVVFPAGFDVSKVSNPASTTIDGGFVLTVSGQTVTIARDGTGTPEPAGPQQLTLANLTNPPDAGTTGPYTIRTTCPSGATLDEDAAVPGDTFHLANLTFTRVQPVKPVAGAAGTATVTFTTACAIPANGKILVVFPEGFDLTGATFAGSSTITGGFSVYVSGQTVTIARDGTGAATSPGAQSIILASVRNPQITGATGTFVIRTIDASGGVIEQDTAVAAITLEAGATLAYRGSGAYVADGADPDVVTGGSVVVFQVVYTEPDNEAPMFAEVWVDMDGNGYDPHERFKMTPLDPSDTNYSDGCIYTTSVRVYYEGSAAVAYKFVFADGKGAFAQGAAAADPAGTLTVSAGGVPPVLSDPGGPYVNGVSSSVSGGNVGTSGEIFTFATVYTDTNGPQGIAPVVAQVKVDLNGDGVYSDFETFDAVKADPGDVNYADGVTYRYSLPLYATGGTTFKGYVFYFVNGMDRAVGPPAETRFVTVVGGSDGDGDGLSDVEEGSGNLDAPFSSDSISDANDSDTARLMLPDTSVMGIDLDDDMGLSVVGASALGFNDPILGTGVGQPSLRWQGAFVQFVTSGPDPGFTATVRVIFPQDLAPDSELWIYNPVLSSWSLVNFTFADSRTVQFAVTDGGMLDSDGRTDGKIQVALGVGTPPGPPTAGGDGHSRRCGLLGLEMIMLMLLIRRRRSR